MNVTPTPRPHASAKRPPMLPGLTALTLAALTTLCTAPASAASYVATVTVDGTAYTFPLSPTFSFRGGCRQSATATVTATLTWTPSGPLDTTPPPPTPPSWRA